MNEAPLDLQDEYLRKEFARAFGWYEPLTSISIYDRDKKPELRTPTWMEIFVEVGRILAKQERFNVVSNMQSFEERLNSIENQIGFDDDK